MSVSANFRMADRLAGGRLREILSEHLEADKSYDAIGRQLFADFGIEVTRQTVSNWIKTLDLASSTEAAS